MRRGSEWTEQRVSLRTREPADGGPGGGGGQGGSKGAGVRVRGEGAAEGLGLRLTGHLMGIRSKRIMGGRTGLQAGGRG